MALTSQDLVLKLVAGMFGASPGAYLDSLTAELDGAGLETLAIDLGNSVYFKELYPTTQGGHVFAGAFLAQIVPDYSPSNPQHLAALNWLAGEFDAGVPPGLVVLHALEALYALSPRDATWGATRAHWDDLTAIATHVDQIGGNPGSTLEELQDAVHGPVFASAAVTGATLVMSYSDLNGLAASPVPLATSFNVTVGGVSRAVSAVAVNASSDTVTLTLASAVAHGDVVTVDYTDPTASNDSRGIQDVFGNDASTITGKAVTNSTVDTVGPAFASASVSGSTVVLTYSDSSALDSKNAPAIGAFTVVAGGDADAVTAVTVDAAAKTITLTLETAVTDSQVVTVAYKDPTSGNDTAAIQDALGNDAASLTATKATNDTPDSSGPVFDAATIDGDTLVMTYKDASVLENSSASGPRASAFTVKVGGSSVLVDAVAVDAEAKTVTLTLASAAVFGQAVTVAYVDPTSGDDARAIQDGLGNDAATLTTTTVTNETGDKVAPTFASATVTNSSLVMTFTEATKLDDGSAHAPLASQFAVKVGGTTDTVTAVSVNASSKTVTLTLTTPATDGQTVTVAYTDTTKGEDDTRAIQDAAGNDVVTFAAQPVTNGTPDTTAPTFSAATVNGSSLQMTYTDLHDLNAAHPPVKGDFTVTVGGVADAVTNVSITGKIVTLTLTTAATNGQAVTLDYTDLTPSDANAIQDLAGNDAAHVSVPVVTNATPLPPADTAGPTFVSGAIDGATLVLTYTDATTLDVVNKAATTDFVVKIGASTVAVNSVSVDADLKTVTLVLATAAVDGDHVQVSYTDPSGNAVNAVQDALGNDASSFGLTDVDNNTLDVTAPVLATAVVLDKSLVLTYAELNALDATHVPAEGDFTVFVGATENVVLDVAVNPIANTVTLTLTDSVSVGATVTLDYDANGVGNIQDEAGNDAVLLTGQPVDSGVVVP